MNSEELELSLRTEFESYLKDVFAEMRQEISQLQEKFDAELERHKSELDGVFSNILNRFEPTQELDAGFKDSVIEHLRLAKDEGARITATAIAQAEELEAKSAPATGIKEIYEAISDISSHQSQAEILKSLVQHAEQFSPRGAFFIIKNEHLVGWRVFGNENSSDEKMREVVLPLSSQSILSEAVKSLETVNGSSVSYDDDAEFFNRFEFSGAQQSTAIPLVARGRGVAVLYADGGTGGSGSVNVEALETLVRVAGLTVEVLASSKGAIRREPVKPAFVVAEDYSATEAVDESVGEQKFETEEAPAEVSEYYAPEAEAEQEPETAYEPPVEPQPFYDPAPSLAPSVRDDVPEESATEELPEQPLTDAYQAEEYQVEEPVEKTEFESEELSPLAEDSESPEDTEEKDSFEATTGETLSEEYAVSPAFVETQDYSAREYAENFARETDPSEYAKDFSYQSEASQTEETKDFSYSSKESQSEESKEFSYQTEDSKDFSYQPPVEPDYSYAEPKNEFQYEEPVVESSDKYETEQTESFNAPVEAFTTTSEPTYETFEPQAEKQEEPPQSFEQPIQSFEPVVSQPVVAAPTKSRLSERNVDLPIEVSEDERRLHNDARRFARLLVSEIKLYNEQKVKEGRDSGDLYDRLREAIDRSREMYDKRVQPPVAAKFDYFHYEILNTLAEGDENKLGAGYPGSNV